MTDLTERAMHYSNGMSHSEARKFVQKRFARMGMALPKQYARGGNWRPTRIDLVVSQIRAFERNPKSECGKQCHDMLAAVFHCDPFERIAATARLKDQGVVITGDTIELTK